MHLFPAANPCLTLSLPLRIYAHELFRDSIFLLAQQLLHQPLNKPSPVQPEPGAPPMHQAVPGTAASLKPPLPGDSTAQPGKAVKKALKGREENLPEHHYVHTSSPLVTTGFM